jgi:hypothetical protein
MIQLGRRKNKGDCDIVYDEEENGKRKERANLIQMSTYFIHFICSYSLSAHCDIITCV